MTEICGTEVLKSPDNEECLPKRAGILHESLVRTILRTLCDLRLFFAFHWAVVSE